MKAPKGHMKIKSTKRRVAAGERQKSRAPGIAAYTKGETIVRSCRMCGCTDRDCRGCVERTGAPCSWVAKDLCSACVLM